MKPTDMKSFLYYLLMTLILVIFFTRCTRKVATQRSETTTQDASKHVIDSLTEVTHTLSEAYESLLQSQATTEVTVKDTGATHIPSEVTVHPDGSKTIKGGTIVYRDNALTSQRISNLRSWIIDSMSSLHKLDTAGHAVKTLEVVRTVKQTVFPWWFWLLLIPAALIGYIVRHKLNPLHI